jgi:hypothetical protein
MATISAGKPGQLLTSAVRRRCLDLLTGTPLRIAVNTGRFGLYQLPGLH